MPGDLAQIGYQLVAFLETLRTLPAKQKEQMALSQCCEDANRLLELAKQASPEVDPRLWPTPLIPEDQHSFRYVEVETFVLRVLGVSPCLQDMTDTTIDFHN